MSTTITPSVSGSVPAELSAVLQPKDIEALVAFTQADGGRLQMVDAAAALRRAIKGLQTPLAPNVRQWLLQSAFVWHYPRVLNVVLWMSGASDTIAAEVAAGLSAAPLLDQSGALHVLMGVAPALGPYWTRDQLIPVFNVVSQGVPSDCWAGLRLLAAVPWAQDTLRATIDTTLQVLQAHSINSQAVLSEVEPTLGPWRPSCVGMSLRLFYARSSRRHQSFRSCKRYFPARPRLGYLHVTVIVP